MSGRMKLVAFVSGLIVLMSSYALISGCGSTGGGGGTPLPAVGIIFEHCFGTLESDGTNYGKIELMGMSFDGSGKRALTEMPTINKAPSLPKVSPDGRKVAYLYQDYIAYSSLLRVMNIDGSNNQEVALNTSSFAWSPDSSSLAYIDDATGGSTDLYVRNINTMAAAELITVEAGAGGVSWVYTGDKIVHIDDSGYLRLIDVASKEDLGIISTDINDTGFSCSPTENKVLFQIGSMPCLGVYDIDAVQLTTFETTRCDTAEYGWTPDGSAVYFVENTNYTLCLVTADGSAPAQTIADHSGASERVFSPRFFPGSDKIYYTVIPYDLSVYGYDSAEVYSLILVGTSETRMTDDTYFDALDTWPFLQI